MQILSKYKLTPQEQRVVLLAMAGHDDTRIGDELGISRETVRVYWKRIRERVGETKRAAIVSKLMREAAEDERLAGSDEREQLLLEITRRTLVEEQLRAVLDGAKDFAIILMNPDRLISEWNKGAENITGWTCEEAIGETADIIFTVEDRKNGVPEEEARTASEKGSTSDVRWHVRKNQSKFWAVGSMHAIFYEDGSLRGFVKVFADETRLKDLEADRSR